MEDMATGEIRLSILWEWVHKGARLTEDDAETGTKAGDIFSVALFERILKEEYNKLLKANNKDVYDQSKITTLPVSREIAEVYTLGKIKAPWFVDLLNINLNNTSLDIAKERIKRYMDTFSEKGKRITENLDFNAVKD
jgi:malate synthase